MEKPIDKSDPDYWVNRSAQGRVINRMLPSNDLELIWLELNTARQDSIKNRGATIKVAIPGTNLTVDVKPNSNINVLYDMCKEKVLQSKLGEKTVQIALPSARQPHIDTRTPYLKVVRK